MTNTKVKLIRLAEGLYRTDSGDTTVIRSLNHAEDLRWVLKTTDGLGCRIVRRFASLQDARSYLNRGF